MRKRNWLIRTLIFFLVTLLIFFVVRHGSNEAMTNESISECQWDIGFIITRHVNTPESNKVWIQCVKQIHKFYPDYPIVILDDNSNMEFVNEDDEQDDFMDNVHVHFVEPEHYKSAELLPYYYNYVNKWLDTMIFIQDSIFINSYYDFKTVDKVKFIGTNPKDCPSLCSLVKTYLLHLDNNKELLDYYEENKWELCWGVMSVMKYNFLKKINEKYNLSVLLKIVKNRDNRICCERVWGIICCYEAPELEKEPSIFGKAYDTILSANYNYDLFKTGVLPDSFDKPILKISLDR